MWFEKLVGFKENNPKQVQENIKIVGEKLISKINKKEFFFGKLEIPSLEELRNQFNTLEKYNSQIKVSEIVGDIQSFHRDSFNNKSVIQVASQFNLLEMVSPYRTPEDGVGIYEYDATQGPACAISCGAGTIYRNYFINVNGKIGQTVNNQIDCLKDIGIELENDKHHFWEMKNGYALVNAEGLSVITNKIKSLSKKDYEYLKGKLRIGIQWNSEVTISEHKNLVTQIYCSALPVSYTDIEAEKWSEFAKLILESTYEATFYTALRNYELTNNNKVFLTLIGGGAFGNKIEWIFNAIKKSIKKFSNTPLEIYIVSHGRSNPAIQQFIDSIEYKAM